MKKEIIARRILIKGVVQGVGFRPFVYNLAQEHQLTGWVSNSSRGVEIEINGLLSNIENFLHTVKENPPTLARIDKIISKIIQPNGYKSFEIRASENYSGEFIPISPDIAICNDCRRELFDPQNPRYHYPFINCTNCGPRFSIIQNIPYDRPYTTMQDFDMCSFCQSEYNNPSNRRFHAQPIACPNCGPHVWLQEDGKQTAVKEDAIQKTRQLLKEGKIIAIKGLGGFHIACDASNSKTIQKLRIWKHRTAKPFAVMVFNKDIAYRHGVIFENDVQLLEESFAPILLCEKKVSSTISPLIAPNLNQIGLMLAYTPLHLLLLEPEDGYLEVLVMTSGNKSEEPIVYTNQSAYNQLSTICDAFLFHNRDIHMRIDDSVIQKNKNSYLISRRARGFAPNSIRMPHKSQEILAVGAQLKNTFCLTRDDYAFVSHHIGDLENYENIEALNKAIQHYQNIFIIAPKWIVSDQHPDYASTKYAVQRCASENIRNIQVQHHHAHMASCLVDNSYTKDSTVIGVILDGTGFGTDRNIWGGEFLVGGLRNYTRFLHLPYMPLPGGDASIKKTYRNALAQLDYFGIEWGKTLPPVSYASDEEMETLKKQLKTGINVAFTSSMGRLFDAISSCIGICHEATYEAQAAIELEAIIDNYETAAYEIPMNNGEIDLSVLWSQVIKDINHHIPAGKISAKFHNAIIQLVINSCEFIRAVTGVNLVVLSGGVWQNRYLIENTIDKLYEQKFTPIWHHQMPTNDGGISLGQAAIASVMISELEKG